MAFTLTSFEAYGVYRDEPLTFLAHQYARFSITAANTDVDLDIGDYSGTFWTAVGSTVPGLTALKVIKDINVRAKTYLSVGGNAIAGYAQADASQSSIVQLTSAATTGGNRTENNLVVTGILPTDTILSVDQSVEGAGQNQIVRIVSAVSVGGGATETYTVTGLTTTDTILSVQPRAAAASSIIGLGTQGTGTLQVTYAADPGAGATVIVTVLRAGGNPVVAWSDQQAGTLDVVFARDPGAGAVAVVTVQRAGVTGVQAGTYQVAMDGTNTNLPNYLFSSGDAPTSYVIELCWLLKGGEQPTKILA